MVGVEADGADADGGVGDIDRLAGLLDAGFDIVKVWVGDGPEVGIVGR